MKNSIVCLVVVLLANGCEIKLDSKPLKPFSPEVKQLFTEREQALAKHRTMRLTYNVHDPIWGTDEKAEYIWHAPDRLCCNHGEQTSVFANESVFEFHHKARSVSVWELPKDGLVMWAGWMIPSKVEALQAFHEVEILEHGEKEVRTGWQSSPRERFELWIRKSDFLAVKFVEPNAKVWTLEKAEFDVEIDPALFNVEIPEGYRVTRHKVTRSAEPSEVAEPKT